MNQSTIQNHSDELRATYLGAVPHTLFTAAVWIAAAIIGDNYSTSTAILFFILGGSLIFPGGELIRKLMKAPQAISPENKLPQFFTLLAFTIPLSYPLIYLACKGNTNMFFPAFTILIGAHYLPFVYGYRMMTFGLLSILLVIIGTLTGIFFSVGFSTTAYITGGILLLFALLHFLKIKKEFL